MSAAPTSAGPSAPMWTCLSCSIGFPSPDAQREHYRSDLHRYNMKRRVAGLPAVRQDVFASKVSEMQGAAEGGKKEESDRCEACAKSFSSANAYRTHVASRKHKETEAAFQAKGAAGPSTVKAGVVSGEGDAALDDIKDLSNALSASSTNAAASAAVRNGSLEVSEDATEQEIEAAIDMRIASAKRIDPRTTCIFCLQHPFASLDESLEHMQRAHGLYVPEREYLTDLPGLMLYLADKVAVGHLCLMCNGRGRGFATAEAARKHMLDKSHCKIAYEQDDDVMELSDFYDFTSSYPDAEWEDASGSEIGSDDEMVDGDADEEESDLPKSNGIRYGDSEMELVLPSGKSLGHRSMRRHYNQNLRPSNDAPASAGNGSALAHRLAHHAARRERDGENGDLLHERGGQVVKARNRGEARDAKRHITEFRDVKQREMYRTKVAYKANSQKHFRDPLLQ